MRHDLSFKGRDYLAGSDDARARDVVNAITNPDVDAIVFARGGYGAMRILERLPTDLLRRHPKWLVGYSDITALHLWAQHQGVASLHGPLAESLAKRPDQLVKLRHTLTQGPTTAYRGLTTLVRGQATGRLIGGNLSLIAALIGTRWLPSLDGVILMLEEIAEPMYRIDRMIQSLLLDDRAAGLQGVVLGDFTKCGGNAPASEVIAQVGELFAPADVPVLAGLPVGHGERNVPLVLGPTYTLDGDAGTLSRR